VVALVRNTFCCMRRYFGGVTRHNILLGLKHSCTTSFGSLCFSSFVLTAVDIVRSMANRRRGIGFVVAIVVSCFAELIKVLTNFATVQMAATGEAFWEAACNVSALLTRNALNSIRVWWMPSFVLTFSAFFFSAVWGVLLGFVSYGTLQDRKNARWVRLLFQCSPNVGCCVHLLRGHG
jgi:Plasma-membrane choline transporter